MEALYLIFFFIIGLFLGSFFCVVGMRFGRGEGFVKGHSHCDLCNHPLKWYDLIPLVSFIFLKGKCRYCKGKIQPILFFIELFTGLLFMISYYSFGFSASLIFSLFSVSLTMIVMTSDFLYLMIPDEVLLFFSICFIVIQLLVHGIYSCLLSIGSGILLFSFMYLLMLLGNFLFKKETLGGGDIKLLFVIGLVIEPILGFCSIFLASFIALPISFFLFIKKRENMIPFGPFLLVGLLIILFAKISTSDIMNFLDTFTLQLCRFMV